MKYSNKEIADLSDTELIEASQHILNMHDEFHKKRGWDYLEKRKNRKINSPIPPANPNFIALKEAIKNELDKRKLVK